MLNKPDVNNIVLRYYDQAEFVSSQKMKNFGLRCTLGKPIQAPTFSYIFALRWCKTCRTTEKEEWKIKRINGEKTKTLEPEWMSMKKKQPKAP